VSFDDLEIPRVAIRHEIIGGHPIPVFEGEFWTSRQRQASSLHEVSYRACFKPQLPAFFIERLTESGDHVYDPFAGRGTTIIEAALRGRFVTANDLNPLSRILIQPRLNPPDLAEIADRLNHLTFEDPPEPDRDLSMFFHPETLKEILCLRRYLELRRTDALNDAVDDWIRLVATNRLTGHSRGFFSVYSLPPNQAVTPDRQILINQKTGLKPPYRDIRKAIVQKSRNLLSSLTADQMKNLRAAAASARLLSQDSRDTPQIPDESIHLTVTSPPFLEIVQYKRDNWLRCWFNQIDLGEEFSKICNVSKLAAWGQVMREVMDELYRVTAPGGWVIFEVGEVRNGTIRLEETAMPQGVGAGFQCAGILINTQLFSKTSNIWGVSNNRTGTNTNRIVMFWKNPVRTA